MSQRGLSGEIAIPNANSTEGTIATPNIVLHLEDGHKHDWLQKKDIHIT